MTKSTRIKQHNEENISRRCTSICRLATDPGPLRTGDGNRFMRQSIDSGQTQAKPPVTDSQRADTPRPQE